MKKYVLEIWVNAKKRNAEAIIAKLHSNLGRFSDATVKVEERGDATIIRVQSNNLDALSSCHKLEQWSRDELYIGRDDSSNEARIKAYPILAEIELSLRHFINRAMTEVYGFAWWEKIKPPTAKRIEGIERNQDDAKKHPPLEFTFLEDLVSFVEANESPWSNDQLDAFRKLKETTSDSDPEFTSKLEEHLKEISFWDDIFKAYFGDIVSWTEVKTQLIEIQDIRNRVAHHRGFLTIQQVEKLKKIRTEVNSTLAVAKRELTSDEREKLKKTMRSIGMIRQLVEFLPLAATVVIEMIYSQSKTHKEISKELGISEQEVKRIEKQALRDLRNVPSVLNSIFESS